MDRRTPHSIHEWTIERRTPHTMYELLAQDFYRADDVATLLGIGLDIVRHAAFTGELHAEIVGHHILRLHRTDVLVWMGTRESARQYGSPASAL